MTLLEKVRSGHLREEIEHLFGLWGEICFRFRWLILAAMLPMLALIILELGKVQFDSSMEGFFWDDDPTLVRYNEFRDQFGREDKVLIAIQGDVFSESFLRKLSDFHERAEQEIAYLEEVDSLINARMTLGVDDELVVKDFLEDWPQNQAELEQLKKFALDNPMYRGNYINEAGTITVMHVQNMVHMPNDNADDYLSGFDTAEKKKTSKPSLSFMGKHKDLNSDLLTGEANNEIKDSINKIVAEFDSPDFRISVASGPYTTSYFMSTTRSSMLKYTGYGIVLIVVLLTAIFRRAVMIFLPLTVAIFSMLCSMSFMGLMNIPLSFSMQIVPSFLLAVGVGNSVHVFTIFFQEFDQGKTKQEALASALRHSGLAIFMTGITTAGGLLSFLSSNMKPIAEFGAITPLGVLFALTFSLTLLPAMIAVFPMRKNTEHKTEEEAAGVIGRVLVAMGLFAVRYPKRVLGAWAIVLAGALYFALQINFSFYIYNQLPPDHFLIKALRIVDQQMSGAAPLEIIVDSGSKDGVKDPDFLNRLDQVYDLIERFEYDGQRFNKLISIVDINKELNQALHGNDPAYYTIPQDRALIAQELLLFENSGSEDLEKLVDSQFRYARLSFLTNSVDGIKFGPIMAAFTEEFDAIFGDRYEVRVTGLLDLTLNIFRELYYSMASTYIVAFLIITPLMILLIGSIRVGLISMIPNLSPIVITLGMMGLAGIDLTTATLLTGSIAMGLVVDDTIHFMHNFQRFFARSGSVEQAVSQTMKTAGKAITFTTLVLSSAFFIFMLNEVIEWMYFGLVTGFCLIMALLADVLLAPALMAVLNANKQTKVQAG